LNELCDVDEATSSRQDVHAPAINLTEQKKTAALREKMEVIREKRRVNAMLGCVCVCYPVFSNLVITRYFVHEIRSPISELTGQCHGWELNP